MPAGDRTTASGAHIVIDDIAVIWAFIIAFAVFAYVVLDGFDLGIGMLFPLFPEKRRPRRDDELRRPGLGRQRDLAGARRRRADGGIPAGLCGADAGLYTPMIVMLLGLVFRGVAFEFRWRTTRDRAICGTFGLCTAAR
jgi:cytochrome d ubiquinol oxidase subunit II